MATVLRKLPFFKDPSTVTVRGEQVRVKRDQIIVWTSVSLPGQTVPAPTWPRFPAILDTGLSHNFALREEHLADWAVLPIQSLRRLEAARLSGVAAHLFDAHLWLYRNRPGRRDDFRNAPAFGLELDEGIAVYPRGTAGAPRLPVLGLRALRQAGLQLHIDCRTCHVDLWTPRWFWLLSSALA